MLTKISCLTKHSETPIIFTLIGNDFTDRFLKKLKWVKDMYYINSLNDYHPLINHPWDSDKIKSFETSIKQSIQWLNDNGYRFPIPVEEIILENNSTSRNLLNRLHRHFTTSHRTVSHGEQIKTWLDNSPYTFEFNPLVNSYQEFSEAVHNINTQVHNAEQFYLNERMKKVRRFAECTVCYNSTNPINPANDPQSKYFTPITADDYKYFSDAVEKYDVWLPIGEMQGKNYYRSYFDEDDPTHWDISSNHYYSGSFTFTDRSPMKHPDMIDYLKSYGIEPGPLTVGIPLGNVIQGKELLQYFDVNDVIKVDVIE